MMLICERLTIWLELLPPSSLSLVNGLCVCIVYVIMNILKRGAAQTGGADL
jgi:hypothetical protein